MKKARLSQVKFKKYMALAAVFIFSFSVFTLTAFAVGTDTGEMPLPGETINDGTTAEQVPITDPVPASSSANLPSNPDTSGSSQTVPSDPNSVPVSDPNGEISDPSISTGESSIPGEDSSLPENGDGSSSGAVDPTSSYPEIDPEPAESATPEPPVYIPPPAAIASAPKDSRSPTEFSSGDLDALLSVPESSRESDSSTNGFLLESDAPITHTKGDGGISGLFLGGISLILLGIAGIIFFLYRQIYLKKHPKPSPLSTTPAGSIKKSSGKSLYSSVVESGVADPEHYYDEPSADFDNDYDQYDQFDPESSSSQKAWQTYEDISSNQATQDTVELPPLSQEDLSSSATPKTYTDIDSGRKHGVDSDGFDWDQFFDQNKK